MALKADGSKDAVELLGPLREGAGLALAMRVADQAAAASSKALTPHLA
jgi:hypothetical protein